jgi:hypothetical protein
MSFKAMVSIFIHQPNYPNAALTLIFSQAFRINYPQNGDLVNVRNGLTTDWSYESHDSILLPLSIQYVAASHQEEPPTYIKEDLNVTLGRFTIDIRFGLADYHFLRFIYGSHEYETGHFDITTSIQSKNASHTSSKFCQSPRSVESSPECLKLTCCRVYHHRNQFSGARNKQLFGLRGSCSCN